MIKTAVKKSISKTKLEKVTKPTKPVAKAAKPAIKEVKPRGNTLKKLTSKTTLTKPIKTILITQPKPDSEKSPYFELERKYKIQLDFHPFVRVEGIPGKEFRKQKVDIQNFSAIIFTSRNAIDHFFRIADELKLKISGEMKYFCITESIALYLQKFILYRKRKVFFGDDGTIHNLIQVISKYKTKERFLVPANDVNKLQIITALEKLELEYAEIKLYDTCCNNAAEIIKKTHDMIVFFSPGGIKALFESFPKYKQKETVIGAFGPTTTKAAEDAGLNLELIAPLPNVPSMVTALDNYFSSFLKKK